MRQYSDRFFIIDAKAGTLKINKKEAREIAEYKVILERDKGGKIKGDLEGRKKELAKKELLYVYIMADPFNSYQVLEDKERVEVAKRITGLNMIKWKPDEVIENAIDRYREDVKLSPTGLSFINSKKALKSIGEDVELVKELSDVIRKEIYNIKKEIAETKEEEKLKNLNEKLNTKVNALVNNNKEVTGLIKKIPELQDIISRLSNIVADETNEKRKALGDREIGNREDPE